MQITSKEIAYKKKVGVSKGRDVYCINTIGGLYVMAAINSGGKPEILGIGNHPGLAKHSARKIDPSIVFNDLAKSEEIDLQYFGSLLDQYVALTNTVRDFCKNS
jgi:hypothetical protein